MKTRLSSVSDSHLIKEWHPTKNIDLDPAKLTLGSTKRAWWLCSKGHEWEAIILSRGKRGCSQCSNRKVSPDNSLAFKFPELLRYWDVVLNVHLKPTDVVAGGHREIWWKCEKSHSFKAQIRAIIKVFPKFYCPVCLGRNTKTVPSGKSLLVKYPDLSKEWHPTRNGDLIPDKVLAGSEKKVWWKCPIVSSHEWEANISNRVKGSSCPYCTNKAVDSTNSLEALFPELCDDWHKTKNNEITPKDVVPGSAYSAWWECRKCYYEWSAVVRYRTGLGNGQKHGCPACSNQVVTTRNSLSSLYPEIAKTWHPTLNGKLTPDQVLPGSVSKAWFLCDRNHYWQTQIRLRINCGCPYCSRNKISYEDSIVVTHPHLVKEWHPTKNLPLLPNQVSSGSCKRVWWVCPTRGHEYYSLIYNRAINKAGCPKCVYLNYPVTSIEKRIEEVFGIKKFDEIIFEDVKFRPDFQFTDKLYLNVDGLYWHSVPRKEKFHHFVLREVFEAHQMRILQFYEDEILNKMDIVASIIKAAWGKISIKISARNCEILEYDSDFVTKFYAKNHLIGPISRKINLGLAYKNECVSMISVSLTDQNLMIDRFCCKNDLIVRGGFQRLLTHLIRKFKPKKVISFCDLRYATGKSYEQFGFVKNSVELGWYWTKGIERYNWHQFSNETKAEEKGYFKIYDAGKAKYVLEL